LNKIILKSTTTEKHFDNSKKYLLFILYYQLTNCLHSVEGGVFEANIISFFHVTIKTTFFLISLKTRTAESQVVVVAAAAVVVAKKEPIQRFVPENFNKR
jgi:hypothetical protein